MVSSLIRGCISKKVLLQLKPPTNYSINDLRDLQYNSLGHYYALFSKTSTNIIIIAISKDFGISWDYTTIQLDIPVYAQNLIIFKDNILVTCFNSAFTTTKHLIYKIDLATKTASYTDIYELAFDVYNVRSQSDRIYNGWLYLTDFYYNTTTSQYEKRISRTQDGVTWIHQFISSSTSVNYLFFIYQGYAYYTKSKSTIYKAQLLPDGSLDLNNETTHTFQSGVGSYSFNLNEQSIFMHSSTSVGKTLMYTDINLPANITYIKDVYGADTSYAHTDIYYYYRSNFHNYLFLIVMDREDNNTYHGVELIYIKPNGTMIHIPEFRSQFSNIYIYKAAYDEDNKKLTLYSTSFADGKYDYYIDFDNY